MDVVEMEVNEVCVDEQFRLVTTPAFMYGAPDSIHKVFDGIQDMVGKFLAML